MTRPSHGPPDAGPPRIAAAPFIPPVPDPDVEAARAAAAARANGPGHSPPAHSLDRPELGRRLLAVAIDYALLVLITGRLVGETSLDPTGLVALAVGLLDVPELSGFTSPGIATSLPVALLVWFLLRPFALFAATRTPGQLAMGYRILSAHGPRVGLGTALLRETAGLATLGGSALSASYGGGGLASSSRANPDLLVEPDQRQLPHDRLAGTWPVRT